MRPDEPPIVHVNAAAGEMMIVAPRPDGGPLRVELVLDGVHHAPPAHVHPRSTETFTVVEGELRVRVGRRRWIMQAGESVAVPPGVTHGYAGVPGVPARVVVEVDPAGRMAEFFAGLYGLPAERRVARTGAPRLPDAAALLGAHPADIGLPGLPRVVARPLLALLAAGRARRG